MSKVICKGKYTSDVKYFLRAVEYSGEKIHMQKIYFTDGRIEDVQDDTMIDFSRYDVRKIEKISFILKDSETHIEMSVEKYQEKIKKPKASIKTSNIIELDDFEQGDSYSECETGFLGYLDYTANRLGAEKEGGMGLFGVGGNIAMDEAEKIARKADEDGVKIYWMNIISISREDGDRLGFNNRQAWKDLIISKAPDIAKAYNISMENFKMYVGFHSNQKNSYHVHLSFHSTSPKDGYIKNGAEGGFEAASEKVKSVVLNTIFKDDVAEIKRLINTQRKDISQTLTNAMANIAVSDNLNNSFLSLVEDLKENDKGKAEYGYLKANSKKIVANVLRDITENDIDLKTLTSEYFKSCEEQVRLYMDEEEKVQARMANIKERFFNPDYHHNDSTALHNIIIKLAKAYFIGDLPSDLRATKEELKFYDLPQESASDIFQDFKKILDFNSFEEIPIFKDEDAPPAAENNNFRQAEEMSSNVKDIFVFDVDIMEKNGEIIAFNKETRPIAKKMIYSGCKDLFNPQIRNTFFQDELINQFEIIAKNRDDIYYFLSGNSEFNEELKIMLESEKTEEHSTKKLTTALSDGIDNLFNYVPDKITSLILNYSNKYSKNLTSVANALQTSASLLNLDDDFNKQFSEKNIRTSVDEALFKYGIRWKDNKYYQLLESYKEDFQPKYSKKIFEEINKDITFDFFKSFASDIKNFEDIFGDDYIQDDEISEFINGKIRKFWSGKIISTEEHKVYIENFENVIKDNFEGTDGIKYSKRFKSNIENVKCRMSPHFLPLLAVKNINEMIFNDYMKKNKLKPEIKDYLKKTLFNSLGNQSLLESQISQKLKEIFLSEKPFLNEETIHITQVLYHLDNEFKKLMDDWVQEIKKGLSECGITGDIAESFKGVWSNYEKGDERMVKLFISSPIANFINGYGKNILNSYQKHHLVKFEQFQKSICKETKETLLQLLNNDDEVIKLFAKLSESLKNEKGVINYETTTEKIQELLSNLKTKNKCLEELMDSFKDKALSDSTAIIPEDITKEYKEHLERSFSNGSLSFSFNAMLFGMAKDSDKTYAYAMSKFLKKDHEELKKYISKSIYKTLQLPKSKLEKDELYSIIRKIGTEPIEKEEKELLSRQATIYILKKDKKIADLTENLKNKFEIGANQIPADKKHQLFNDVFIFDSYTGVSSTVRYMGENQNTLMTKIQATKKKIIIRAMCQAVAQMIYSSTRENTSKLSHNNEDNKTFSTNKGEFSNKRTNLSSDLTFTNL